jgi:hypothetical protein
MSYQKHVVSCAEKRATHTTHLHAALAQKLVPRAERDLNDRTELREFLGGVVLNVRYALAQDPAEDPTGKKKRGNTAE